MPFKGSDYQALFAKERTMRERIDCAVLLSGPNTDEWSMLNAGEYLNGRLAFHRVGHDVPPDQLLSGLFLRDNAMILRRYDVCVVNVSPGNLPWARRLLLAAQGSCSTPVLAVVNGLKATAIDDLLTLGLSDFVRVPVCYDEVRARAQQLLGAGFGYRYGSIRIPSDGVDTIAEPSPGVGESASAVQHLVTDGYLGSEQDLCDTILQRTGLELDAYAVATASRSATSKESFRAAKGKVIERFERAYIAAALGRCSGNIAMAARSAQKHRRAFWALMRKYQIDANVYRIEGSAKFSPDG